MRFRPTSMLARSRLKCKIFITLFSPLLESIGFIQIVLYLPFPPAPRDIWQCLEAFWIATIWREDEVVIDI